MKYFLFICYLLIVATIHTQEVVDLGISGYFFSPFKMTAIKGAFDTLFYLVQPDDNIPYTQIRFFEVKDANFSYLSDFHNGFKYFNENDNAYPNNNIGSVIEIYGQRFPLGNDSNGKYLYHRFMSYGPGAGNLYLFEYNSDIYFCYYTSARNISYYHYILLFNVTDTEYVKFLLMDSSTYEPLPSIGIYGGQLCVLRISYEDEREAYWSRLYSIEEEGLIEVLDADRRNIELFFKWDKKEWEKLTILEKHIPANPVLLSHKDNLDIKMDIIPFQTGVRDSFPLANNIFRDGDPEGKPTESETPEISEANEAKPQKAVDREQPVAGKYRLLVVSGICFLIITGVIYAVVYKWKN